MKTNAKLLFFLFLLLNPLLIMVQAAQYPWIPISSEDLKIIVDPKVEAVFRLEMVKEAQKNIDIVTFDQRADNVVGMPLLLALKDAADRGVKIRFLTAWPAYALKDPLNYVGRFFNNLETKIPIEFHIIGGPSMLTSGWGILDGIHEKLFIVDDKITLVTGRGHAEEYLHWLDSGLVFKGGLVQQSVEAYQNLWETLEKENFLEARKNLSVANDDSDASEEINVNNSTGILSLSKKEKQEILSLADWMKRPPVDIHSSKEVFSGRLLHFNFIEQMRELATQDGRSPRGYSYEERANLLNDPIVEETINLVNQSSTKDFIYYSLIVNPHPKLKEMMMEKVKNGWSIQLFTNGMEAHKSVVPISIPIGWYASLNDLDDIISAGVKVFAYSKKSPEAPCYVHRKLAVTGDVVFFGSHNLSLPSSVETDEINFEIRSKRFANQMRKLFNSDVNHGGDELDPKKVHEERLNDSFRAWMWNFLAPLY